MREIGVAAAGGGSVFLVTIRSSELNLKALHLCAQLGPQKH